MCKRGCCKERCIETDTIECPREVVAKKDPEKRATSSVHERFLQREHTKTCNKQCIREFVAKGTNVSLSRARSIEIHGNLFYLHKACKNKNNLLHSLCINNLTIYHVSVFLLTCVCTYCSTYMYVSVKE